MSIDAPMAGLSRAAAAGGGVKKRGEFHIPSLDGVRAISFLIVFAAHSGMSRMIPGGFGVTVFFFLSGYLITTLLRMEHARTGRVSLRDFYLRRLLRIFPPFYTVLALALFLSLQGLLPGTLQIRPVLALLGHFANYWAVLHGMAGQPAGTGVYWSLAVEEHFYLLFPCGFIYLQRVLAQRLRAQASILLGCCALVLAWRFILVLLLRVPPDRTFLATDTRVDSILFGCALALGANPILDKPRLTPRLMHRLILPLAFLLLLFSFFYRADWFRESLRYSLQGLALAPFFVTAVREPCLGPFRLLNLRILQHLGGLSYSLYLLHHVILFALPEARLGVWPRAGLALALSVAAAEFIYRAIEKPCARLRRRLAHAVADPVMAGGEATAAVLPLQG